MRTMVHVIATIEVVEGTRDRFLEIFHELVPSVVAEKGCISYGPAIDVDAKIDAQVGPRDNVVTVVEAWESVEALQDHLVAPHMDDYREKVKDIVKSVQIQVLSPV